MRWLQRFPALREARALACDAAVIAKQRDSDRHDPDVAV
jgi:hypothetical protein